MNQIFYSIQGESKFSGYPTVFIRLTGCNLRCVYCDSKYSYHGGSALIDAAIPLKANGQLTPKDEIPLSYVPFRNAHILSIAVSWAEVIGANAIFFGAVEEDSSGYPDCRADFIQAFSRAANLGTKPKTVLEIITPLLHLDKGEIVKKALGLNTPLKLTWSCYQNETIPCGLCDSCLLRKQGFAKAGVVDPVGTCNL